MPELPPEQVTPFVFSDPSGKRWPRLRLILLIGGVLFFVALVLFVQALFCHTKDERTFFAAAVERPIARVATRESCRPGFYSFIAMAEIQRDSPGGEKTSWYSANSFAAPAKESA